MPFGSRARFQRNCREWHRAHPRTAPVFSSPPPREERAGVGTRFYGSNPLSMNLTLVGTSRCDVPAREAAGGTIAPQNAARTAQRAVPTRFRGSKRGISFRRNLTPPLSSFGGGEGEKMAVVANCAQVKRNPVRQIENWVFISSSRVEPFGWSSMSVIRIRIPPQQSFSFVVNVRRWIIHFSQKISKRHDPGIPTHRQHIGDCNMKTTNAFISARVVGAVIVTIPAPRGSGWFP